MKTIVAFNLAVKHKLFSGRYRNFKACKTFFSFIEDKQLTNKEFLERLGLCAFFEKDFSDDPQAIIFANRKPLSCSCEWDGLLWTRDKSCPLHGNNIPPQKVELYRYDKEGRLTQEFEGTPLT